MYKAVIGSFVHQDGAQRAISTLRESGFAGELITMVMRDPLGEGDTADRMLPRTSNRALAAATVVGALTGLIVGAVAGSLSGGSATPQSSNLIVDAVIGLVAGAIIGAIAGYWHVSGGRRAEAQRDLAYQTRGEILVTVATDATNAQKARQALADAGAFEVRRGGVSESDEFALRAVPVHPEIYGAAPTVAPAAGREPPTDEVVVAGEKSERQVIASQPTV